MVLNFSIKYGVINNNIDVTQIALDKCVINSILFIPRGVNNRSILFSDPLHGVVKSIFIVKNDSIIEYDSKHNIYIDVNNNTIFNDETVPPSIQNIFHASIDPNIRLSIIQNKLKLDYGNFNEELPEQLMTCKYLSGNEKVLEIGGNIGRNSLIIGYILNQQNNNNLVTLESNTDICKQLIHNRDINNLSFKIENSALSKRKLIQIGWDTMCPDIILDRFSPVNIISLEELYSKYNINFDTLVIDCEGAFYYIILDMPEILNNINLIIVENDYRSYEHKIYIDSVLKNNNFYVDYSESGGWGDFYNNFYEVWKRK